MARALFYGRMSDMRLSATTVRDMQWGDVMDVVRLFGVVGLGGIDCLSELRVVVWSHRFAE